MKNKKKVTLLGVAFIAAVITLAGVGYAVNIHNSYQGTVSTDVENEYDVDYVVVKFNDNSAYVDPADIKLTWNTETGWVQQAEVVTYTWQASDTMVHGLVITSTDAGTDSYKLKATAAAVPSGYLLYYKLANVTQPVAYDGDLDYDPTEDGWLLYTPGDQQCGLVAGEDITNSVAAITAQSPAPVYITWVVIPDPVVIDDGTAPVYADVTIGGISYVVEATQSA